MSTFEAAQAQSNDPAQPLVIPALYAALRAKADSIRTVRALPASQSIDAPLAIQADRTMRYDLLSRVMQTARVAGFRNLTLQVSRVADVPLRSS
jgi:biopolymer transport protein ExbD